MKIGFGISASSIAIALSLATTAQAQEAPTQPALDGSEQLLSGTSHLTLSAVTVSALKADSLALIDVEAEDLEPLVLNLPAIEEPFSIEASTQEAIYAVDFLSNIQGAQVSIPTRAPQYFSLTNNQQPFFIDHATQEAIYSVNFPLDAGGALISANMAAVDQLQSGIVTPLALSANDLDANNGDIDAFYRDIVAFYGDINAFWRDISPFYRDISAFNGDINPFWRDISPFYGNISAFWGDINAFWRNISAFDVGYLGSLGDYGKQLSVQFQEINRYIDSGQYIVVTGYLNTMRNTALTQFGAKGFTMAEAEEVFARHGVVYGDTSTYDLTDAQRAAFFMDWHDTVYSYSGIDRVDHWMGSINWTPAITQIQGTGSDTVVGIIDANFGATGDLADNLVWRDGSDASLNGHGAGVASLIAAAHDGEGVMGIAPNASITAYNPFSLDGTATWDDVAAGIWAIKGTTALDNILGANRRASIINLSLGESGWVASQGLSDVFSSPLVSMFNNSTVYVIAAGNDGIAQTGNITWDYSDYWASTTPNLTDTEAYNYGGAAVEQVRRNDTAAIFVGSVNPAGVISSFSNTPGTACLTDNGSCGEGQRLMDYFIVAPGEMLLVSDGQGGVTRASGTSFAAPLVSGAIALLHDRWPWLANKPHSTAEIIFRSAQDLGDPGVDPIYGHGLLDVVASQSPLDFTYTQFTLYQKKGSSYRGTTVFAYDLKSGGIPSSWERNDAYFTGFERVGDSYRDFNIPVSSFTYGKTYDSYYSGVQSFQDFVATRMTNWILSGGADKDGDGILGFNQVRSNDADRAGQWSLRIDAIQPQLSDDGVARSVHNSATLTDPSGKLAFTLGHGQGALAIAGNNFGMISDHDKNTGGVNPVLGFASGEMFAGMSLQVAPATKVSFGYSADNETWQDLRGVSEIERDLQRRLGDRKAEALTVDVDQKVTDNLSVKAQFTHLLEQDALLGTQTGIDAFLGEGSDTNAFTLTASMDLGSGFSFDLSATGATTETNDGQAFTNSGAILSSAGQFTLNKRGIANSRDVLRVSIGQPLTVEKGEVEFTMDQVIDRQTGEIGQVTQSFGITTKRRYVGEVVYATSVAGAAELGVVGRYISAGESYESESFMVGANFGLRF